MNQSRSSPSLTRAGNAVLGSASISPTRDDENRVLLANYERDVQTAKEMNWPTLIAPSKAECDADLKAREDRYNQELANIAQQTSVEEGQKREAWRQYEEDLREWEKCRDQHKEQMEAYAKSLQDRVVRPTMVGDKGDVGGADHELQEAIRQSLASMANEGVDEGIGCLQNFDVAGNSKLSSHDLDDLEKALRLSAQDASVTKSETVFTEVQSISKEEDAILEEVLQLSLQESQSKYLSKDGGGIDGSACVQDIKGSVSEWNKAFKKQARSETPSKFKESLSGWNQAFQEQSFLSDMRTPDTGTVSSTPSMGEDFKEKMSLSDWNSKFKELNQN